MDELMNYLPYLAPYLVVSLTLSIVALIHVIKHRNYRFGNVWIWSILVLFFQIIGPIAYFLIGKGEE
ncbi:PLDc_N domain-containing protein [Enterococcus sp. BWB1-3]|uniref:PLDc N-terminal domain-containing protein n=1 Tax=unclassified Enterococcus TaxID=2608891 RepID=UPI001924B057|nr:MULTISPECIES: PLD nuclease N-terminal domain-containing protein [unclassified Enterococcus]MBL1229797.1 PLDc_N domain-containing protein [Enterococcus sp. BWB1-3]MCB5953032.1 PLD nuclease N-terminal domain-containing protein [Enterococcus sp. BWT-B8]MCB5955405.1 PLD nuclease N-terminal domain-containing protein [Enterococcus sp. CWB-B31]